MIVGTAGHIDHGKTALVKALTGIDTDRLPEEKRRGITIELGFASLTLDGVGMLGVVDVPGHEAFVRTMLAGATGIDLAMLIIAADEGVMPQTREHLAILSLLGVRGGVVVLTKRDLVDEDWLELVTDDVRQLVAGSSLGSAPIVATSTVTGQGLDELRRVLSDVAGAIPARDASDLFRMPVDRAFSVRGAGTVVTGTVWSGSVVPDATLQLLPGGRPVRVRGVQSHGRTVDRASAGSRAALALVNVDLTEVARGTSLVEGDAWHTSATLRADVALLAHVERPIRARELVRFHMGTSEVAARIVAVGGPVGPGETRAVRVSLAEPLALRAGDRFVLRRAAPVETVGGGVIVDPAPTHRRARPWTPGLIAPSDRLALVLREAAVAGVEVRTLPIRLGVRPGEVAALVGQTAATRRIGSRVYDRETVEGSSVELVRAVERFHREVSLEEFAPMAWVRSQLSAPVELVDALAADAVAQTLLESGGGGLRTPGWRPTLSQMQGQLKAKIHAELEGAGVEPPSVSEITAKIASDPVPLLRILEKEGLVVGVEADRYYAKWAVDELVERLQTTMDPGREYSPAELREVLGVSRKYLIPFLEYCDRRGVTERRQAGRVLFHAPQQ